MANYYLTDKLAINQEPEFYENTDQLIARLWQNNINNFLLVITDRFDKPNLICDFKLHGEKLWLSAFEDETMKTLYDELVPTGDDLEELFKLINELEKK